MHFGAKINAQRDVYPTAIMTRGKAGFVGLPVLLLGLMFSASLSGSETPLELASLSPPSSPCTAKMPAQFNSPIHVICIESLGSPGCLLAVMADVHFLQPTFY